MHPTPTLPPGGAVTSARVTVDVAACAPSGATAIGIPIAAGGAVPDELGIGRAALAAAGFDGAVGQALALPGTGPAMRVAFGIGDSNELDAPRLRDAAAAFSQSVSRHIALTATLPGLPGLPPRAASAAIVEGILLARYGYDPLKSTPPGPALARLTRCGSVTFSPSTAAPPSKC